MTPQHPRPIRVTARGAGVDHLLDLAGDAYSTLCGVQVLAALAPALGARRLCVTCARSAARFPVEVRP